MTHHLDVARGHGIIARWSAFAEQRLEYLTELFETGRWRRYHTDISFLENIREAKSAVAIWQDLSVREASQDNSAIDISWLGRSQATLPLSKRLCDQTDRPKPPRSEIATELLPSDSSIAGKAGYIGPDRAPAVAALNAPSLIPELKPAAAPALQPSPDDISALTLDIAAMRQRYPLLRKAAL